MKKTSFLFLLICTVRISIAQHSFDTQKLMEDMKILSADDMQGREIGTEGSQKARAYIIGRLKEVGVKPFVPEYIQSFPFKEELIGTNILAVIPGKKKETIVVSAHYDHEGIRNNQIYNGADDNASGVATLLAMIKYFKKKTPNHRIIFAFFDGEEKGLKGSFHFVNSLDLQKENIILNINLDMVSRNDKGELYATGGFHNPNLKSILQKVTTPKGFSLLFGHDDPTMKRNDWTKQSDHFNFHQKKIPFIYFGVEDHPDYHKPTDDFEKINPVFFSNSAETILQSVKALDKQLN